MAPELPNIPVESDEPQVAEAGAATADQLTEREAQVISARIGSLVLENSILREHQHDAFDDLVSFYQSGGREGYIKLPTSTGKTVLFVTLVDQFIGLSKKQGTPARAVVLTPTTQLASQTVGGVSKTGKKRGFKGFAPELDARAVHSSKSDKDNAEALREADVVSTTYDSFRNMIEAFVELEGVDPDDIRKEIRSLELQQPIVERQIKYHKLDAEHYLRDAYKRQLVRFFRQDVGAFLDKQEERPLAEPDAQLLKSVKELIDMTEGDPRGLSMVRRLVTKKMNQNVKDQLTKWQMSAEESSKRATELRETGRNSKRGYPLLEDDPLEGVTLNNLEKTLAKFMWFSRFDRKPLSSELSSYEERTEYTRLVNVADDRRDSLRLIKGRIKGAKKKLEIIEAGLQFNLIICDEAHRSIGTKTWDAIRAYAARKGIAVIGFTATDKYEERNLEQYYGTLIHELTKEEAIERKLTNPVALFVHETGLSFDDVALNIKGDYDKLTMRSMRFNEERNNQAVEYARQLSEAGYSGAISAIPGDEGDHAKVIAEKINNTMMRDPNTGEMRYMRARYILQNSKNRELYLEQFENGEIDWLVYVDVLREGWDSDRAKALINLRSTLSPLLAEQRLGRIGRLSEFDMISIVIDFYDNIIEHENRYALPPVLAADVFGLDNLAQGTIIGNQGDESVPDIITALQSQLPSTIQAIYTRYKNTLQNLPEYGVNTAEFSSKEWMTLDDLQTYFWGYLPKEVILDEVTKDDSKIRIERSRKGNRPLTVFNVHDIEQLHRDKALINPWKLYINPEDDVKWISPEGCTKLFAKKFPHMRADGVLEAIRELEVVSERKFDRSVARVNVLNGPITRNGFTNLYRFDEVIERLVPSLEQR